MDFFFLTLTRQPVRNIITMLLKRLPLRLSGVKIPREAGRVSALLWNSTFDDDVSSNAALFLLRMYVEKHDPVWKPSLDKAINFVLESQYPMGGWPQRYPLKYDFGKNGNPDYTSFYTFNDGVVWENVNFLIQCYVSLEQEKFLDPIHNLR